MRGTSAIQSLAMLLSTSIFFACGYSQVEWDQKVREGEDLRSALKSEQRARAKSDADYADALEEIESLRQQVLEGGMNVSSLNASLEAQKSALSEYAERTRKLEQLRERFEALRVKLSELTRLGLKLEVRDNRMVIQLPGDVLFDSGKDKLRPDGEEILLRVAEVIRNDQELSSRRFQVAGHTDQLNLRGGFFRDNWGLSAMRARSVLVLLVGARDDGGGGLNPKNFSAAGYGSTDPVADDSTPEGRSRNRRVELVAQPDVAELLNLSSLASASDPPRSEQPKAPDSAP